MELLPAGRLRQYLVEVTLNLNLYIGLVKDEGVRHFHQNSIDGIIAEV